MQFAGATAEAVPRFGSLCTWDFPAQLPLGLAAITRNARYTAQSVGCRYGLSTRLQLAKNNPITGLGAIRYLASDASNQEIIELLAYNATDGNLSSFVPFLQPSQIQLTTDAMLAQANLARVMGASPVIAQAFNRGIIAMGNLVVGVGPGLIYDPERGTVDPISDLPYAAPWQPGKRYRVGQVVSPSTFTTFGILDSPGQWIEKQTGFVYQCTTAGTSGITQPVWPTTLGATVGDNGIVWTECTPIALAGLPDAAAPTGSGGGVKSWQANTLLANPWSIVDSNGNTQTIISAGARFTGLVAPVWATVPGAQTIDATTYWMCLGVPGVWAAGTVYAAGTTAAIIDPNGNIQYTTQFLVPAVSGGVAPAWASSGVTHDGSVVWTCGGPTTNPGTAPDLGSPIINGATVYLACTYTNAQGEGINELVALDGQLDPGRVLVWKNTTGAAVDLTVKLPVIPPEFGALGPLGPNFDATGINLYALIVQGVPDPAQIIDPSFYGLVAGGPFASGANVTISGYPTGQQMPTVNTAILNLTPGNIETGVRYMVTIFETRTNYQTGYSASAPVRINITQSGQQLTVLRSPIGPYNCEARIHGFTVAGASAAGPYTYVDRADFESPGFNQPNVKITATRIPDNVTQQATFDFTDTYLPGASDITNYADRKQIPPFVDVYFSKTLLSVVYTGVEAYPSSFFVSDVLDPEAIRMPGSRLDVSVNDGGRAIAWREVRGIQIALKENGGYGVMKNDGDASTWDPQEIWTGSGPAGAKALDVSAEDEGQFLVYAHRTGLYLYEGGSPKLISRELLAEWETINWDYGHLIVVKIDQKRREIRICVPLNGSTTCNSVFTMNYFFGMGDPVVFVIRRGMLVPNVQGRKWSIDDIAAADLHYVPSRSKADAQQAGVDIRDQMIFGSADGSLKTVTDKQYHDQDYDGNPLGYWGEWLCVPGTTNPGEAIFALAGATCSATGNGLVNVYAVDDTGRTHMLSTTDADRRTDRTWRLTAVESQRDFGLVDVEACRYGIGFNNGGVADAWWEMHAAALWVYKKWGSRPG